jgi:uncharacterized protein
LALPKSFAPEKIFIMKPGIDNIQEHYGEQHPIGLSIFLHLFPGLVLLAGFILLGPVIVASGLPSLLAIIIVDAFIVLPLMAGILIYASRNKSSKSKNVPVIGYRKKLKWHWFTILFIATLLWAVLSFILLAPIADFLRTDVFFWVPAWFDLGDYILNPDSYTSGSIIMTWILGLIVTSIAAPVIEELYFRGYLLPRIDRYGAWAPLINVVLFTVYHFWSLWFVPTRVVALLPLVYVVWLKRSIYIAIIVHVLLNLVGDSLLTIPAVFG